MPSLSASKKGDANTKYCTDFITSFHSKPEKKISTYKSWKPLFFMQNQLRQLKIGQCFHFVLKTHLTRINELLKLIYTLLRLPLSFALVLKLLQVNELPKLK